MNPFEVILNSVVPVLLLIVAGFGYSRFRTMDIRALVDFIIDVAVPCLVLARLTANPPSGGDMLVIIAGNAVVVWGVIGLTFLAHRARLTRSRSAFMTAPFANAVNIPVPLALLAFGAGAVTNQLIYAIANMCFMYLVGTWLVVGHQKGIRQVLRLPPVWALVVAVGMVALEVRLPQFIHTPVALVGDTVVPLLLFALGYQLSSMGLTRIQDAVLPVALRMGGGLVMGVLFVAIARPSQPVAQAVLLGCAMPPAIQTYLLCAKFDVDPDIAASGVVLGTVTAALLIPVLVPIIVMYV
ncbi:MAG: AEC family transporter [Pseudomonadota bacterium]